jgi:hypothetical protein
MTINDNEIYESLRISTIFSGHSFVSDSTNASLNDDADEKYFAAHPRRRFLLRISNSGEFDAPFTSAFNATIPVHRHMNPASPLLQTVYSEIPPLWALVSRIMPKVHIVTAVYRGSAFFGTTKHEGRTIADGDEARISALLIAFAIRHGIDPQEWIAFERKYKAVIARIKTTQTSHGIN